MVVIVVTAVSNLDALMVSGIEGVGCHVVSISRLIVRNLHRCDNSIEAHVALHLVGHLDLLTTLKSGKPAAEHNTIQLGDVIRAKGKLADGRLALYLLDAEACLTVGIEIGQRELGVQLGNLFLGHGTYGHVGTIAHSGDSERCSLAGIVEHVDVVAVVLPTGG